MSDELVKQLSSYKAQLQQVEAALSTDPDNEDLLKLQKDLQVRLVACVHQYPQWCSVCRYSIKDGVGRSLLIT